MTTAELAVALSDDEQAQVTIRAELSRLRTVLGPIELDSRPYRLRNEIGTDVDRVREDLAAGRVRHDERIQQSLTLKARVEVVFGQQGNRGRIEIR